MKNGDAAALAAACAKCGTCRTVCTLFPERKTEQSVARGKITLVTAASSCFAVAPESLQEALADCLLCGRCERGCPNQVRVEEIVLTERARLAGELGIPAWKRIVFGGVMPSPAACGLARRAGSAAQKLLLERAPTGSGLHYRFPEKFGFEGRTVPALPAESFTASLGREEALDGEAILFVGCVFDHVLPQVGRAAYETMLRTGRGASVFRDAPCCGLPAMAAGDRASALRCVEENVRRLSASASGPIVFPCGSCLLMFRRNMLTLLAEEHPLYADAVRVADRCVDYAGYLVEAGVLSRIPSPRGTGRGGRVGYHDPCHLSGTLGKGKEAREVLRRTLGDAFAEMHEGDLCCGYGGTFNVRDYPTSGRIGQNRVSAAERGGAAVIATACSGCILQLRDAAARTAPSLRVVHLAELVSQAFSRR